MLCNSSYKVVHRNEEHNKDHLSRMTMRGCLKFVSVRIDGSAQPQFVRSTFGERLFVLCNDTDRVSRLLTGSTSQICEARSHSLSLIASRAEYC
jgi:hypothetical protein